MNNNKIAAVVVTYNRIELLIECIEALKGQTVHNFDILVIDNASTDGTKERLREYISNGDIIYYNTGDNIGGAGGFNYGIKTAYKLDYDLFWLMDDDTIPSPTALEKLLNAAEELNNEYGYLVSKALWTDGTLCQMNRPSFAENDNLMPEGETKPVEIKRATFVSFLTTREIIKVTGLPIKEFFLWADDTNFCFRINYYAKGYFVPDSVVVHKMIKNNGVNIVSEDGERLERYCLAYRNRYYNARMQKELLRYYAHIMKKVVQIMLFSKDNKSKRVYYMLKGLVEGWGFKPSIEYCH